MDLIGDIKKKAASNIKKVVLPEGQDERIVNAAVEMVKQGIAHPVVLFTDEIPPESQDKLKALGDKATFGTLDPEKIASFASIYAKKRDQKESMAARLCKRPLMYGSMMVSTGDADAMVAGAANTTAAVIQNATLAVGTAEGISKASSFFAMLVPDAATGEERLLIYADCAVIPDPTADELAEIAVVTGKNAKTLFGLDPKVALLSFSSKGSASHPHTEKVIKAVEKAQQMAPDMAIDGEFQVDTAIVEKVANKKLKERGPVSGQANVLVFPDLDAGNIAYKLTQYLAGAKAIGPVLQGFAKPVCDLSRGASVEDIVSVSAIMAVIAGEES